MPTTPRWCPPPRCRSPRSIFSNRGSQGQLITTDPTEDDAGLSVFNLIVEKYGWDYMDKYMAQKPAFVTTGHAAVSNAIAAGEKLATFDSTSTTPRLKQQGKPIEPVFSQADPTPVFLVGAAIFKDAPHPNAAKLYLTWYLAKEQQSRTGTFSPRADVPPPAGPGAAFVLQHRQPLPGAGVGRKPPERNCASGSAVTSRGGEGTIPTRVIAGLDPAIHLLCKNALQVSRRRWTRGSSPIGAKISSPSRRWCS